MTYCDDLAGEQVAAALTRLFERDGLSAPSVRAVANEIRASASGLMQRFDDKDRMLTRAAHAWTQLFLAQLRQSLADRLLDGFVAQDDDELAWRRALMAWEELGRSSPGVAAAVSSVWQEIPWLIRAHDLRGVTSGLAGDAVEMQALPVVVRGLWCQQCDRSMPLSTTEALRLWHASITAFSRSPLVCDASSLE